MKLKSGVLVFVLVLFMGTGFYSCSKPGEQKVSAADGPNSWYKVEKLADNVWRIDDHGNDNMYVVTGDEKALLIDTGIGVGDLAACVKEITDLPLIVVNTHGHPDHAAGNYQFPLVYANPLDAEMIALFTSKEYHENTLQQTKSSNPELAAFLVNEDKEMLATEYVPTSEGFVFDLGNRKLEVIDAPGHTPGEIVLLDAENKQLFTGDNSNGLSWLFLDGCLPLEGYNKTLQKLIDRNDEYDITYPGHGGPLDKDFIGEQLVCVQQIVNGECNATHYENNISNKAMQWTYKRATIAFDPDNIHL